MNFQHYQNLYALNRYENNIHSTADFGGNKEAADVAGKLFDRWQTFSYVAENANYSDERRNGEADQAYALYEEFTAMLHEADHI